MSDTPHQIISALWVILAVLFACALAVALWMRYE